MKKIFLVIFLAIILIGLPIFAYAHPPQDIKITYDPQAKLITAVIYHQVSTPASHYIKKVDVGLNGKEIISQSISRQDDYSTQTIIFYIPELKIGDKVSIEAYCSISGSLEKEIKIQ